MLIINHKRHNEIQAFKFSILAKNITECAYPFKLNGLSMSEQHFMTA